MPVGRKAATALAEVSIDQRLGTSEAFAILNHARTSMLSLVNMYVTGTGIFLVAVAAAGDRPTRLGIAGVAALFVFANLSGFESNLKFQHVTYHFLLNKVPASEPSYAVAQALKPSNKKMFMAFYIVVSAAVLSIAAFLPESTGSIFNRTPAASPTASGR